jgi:alanyl-tRNA synthetase
VEDFDVSACGGTHVRRTGEIGSVVIRKVERVNRQARVEFACGRRSVVSGQRDLETLSLVARQLSVGLNEAPARVEKQIQERRQLRKTLQVKNRMLAGLLAKELYAQVEGHEGRRIVKQLFEDEEMEFLKLLAQSLVSLGNCVVLLGSGGPQARCLLKATTCLAI